jgi:hypothetical protein
VIETNRIKKSNSDSDDCVDDDCHDGEDGNDDDNRNYV